MYRRRTSQMPFGRGEVKRGEELVTGKGKIGKEPNDGIISNTGESIRA